MSESKMREYILQRYDTLCSLKELREYYGQSDFMNFGYWEEETKDQKEACENLMEKLLSFIPEKCGAILDVACGKGETTRCLLNHYPAEQITAINISEKQLEIARGNVPGATFLCMNATELRFPDESFDNIICVEAAFHFNTREKFFFEAKRVLRPGGHLVLSDILMTVEGERKRESRTEKNYVKNLEEYRKLLDRLGFGEITLLDATEQSWVRHFWYAVHYFHGKFFSGEIDREQMQDFLYQTYLRVPDIKYYLLASARKLA